MIEAVSMHLLLRLIRSTGHIIPAREDIMAKFGLFRMGGKAPISEYEGDYMQRNAEFVEIRKRGTIDKPEGELVAVVRIVEGHDIRKITD
jgi:hypothetical protein